MNGGTRLFILAALVVVPICNSFLVGNVPTNRRLNLRSVSSQNENIGERVNGDVSPVIQKEPSFSDLGLTPQILTAVKAQGNWGKPTPVQQFAIPRLLELVAQSKEGPLKHSQEPEFTTNTNTNTTTIDMPVTAVWCEAPTGSGKTAAYALPLLQNLHFSRNPYQKGRIAALVLCPTRELVVQVGNVIQDLASNVSTKRRRNVMALHGGSSMQSHINKLADYSYHGTVLDILVATPGRLLDVLTFYAKGKGKHINPRDAAVERRILEALDAKGKGDVSLSGPELDRLNLNKIDDQGRASLVNLLENVKFLVLDEADRLLGNEFQEELDSVLKLLPKRLPTWMFTATFPKSMESRLDRLLKRIGAESPIRIECTSADRVVPQNVTLSSTLQKRLNRTAVITAANTIYNVGPASTINLRSIKLRKNDRTVALRRLLEENPEWERVLVFVGTRYATGHVARKLEKYGIKAGELHGDMPQDRRLRSLNDLKRRKIRVLLATDLASRGIDISGLELVVNYDLPRSSVDFVHRVGRTGRAGRKGTAITFVTAATETHLELIENRHLVYPMVREVLPGLEPNAERWLEELEESKKNVPGAVHSVAGLAHDRMFGGIKGRKKNKKDKLREAGARQKVAAEAAARKERNMENAEPDALEQGET